MLRVIDQALDRVTMYRLTLYYLLALLGAAFVLALAGVLPIDPLALASSAAMIFGVSLLTSALFARVFGTPANPDSVVITALILVLILNPAKVGDVAEIGAVAFAAIWAMASKYILSVNRKQLFNPAAFGAVAAALALNQPASWWVAGNLPLLPVVAIGGILIVRKLRRADLIVSYLLATMATQALTTPIAGFTAGLTQLVVYSPLLFMGFVMLTEPATTPPVRATRIAYGALVGILATPAVHAGPYYLTPELALLIGNLFAFAVSPKARLELTLLRIEQSAASALDFVFGVDRAFAFRPGQYLEFALDVPRSDSRGNRRYFTVASSPTEAALRVGVKFKDASSAFKRAMAAMRPGDKMFAGQLAGDFVLPADPKRKIAFIAGGIGVTPFRSMVQYLLDRGERRPIVLLYGVDRATEVAYRPLWEEASRKLDIRTAYAVAKEATPKGAYAGYVDEAMIRAEVPDFLEREFYISGPRALVVASEKVLTGMGVHRRHIKSDFFPGFA